MWMAGCALAVIFSASNAQAQMVPWEDKGYVGISVGVQAQGHKFTEVSRPEIYGEAATLSVAHDIDPGLLFDVAGGVRVWKNLAVGIGFSAFSKSETPTLNGEIPNPLTPHSPRSTSVSTGELSHRETAVHLQLLWMLPLTNEFDLAFVAGPSFYNIQQDVITNISLAEGAAPFTSVSITAVENTSASKRATGFTIGVDGSYVLTPRYGAGMFIRYSAASADLETSGGTVSVDAGGFQVGVGLRVKF